MQPITGLTTWLNKASPPVISKFHVGQILAGNIIKFYPNQLAEIQLNGMKMTAQLEIPAEAGVRHLFRVEQTDRGHTYLKVLTKNTSSSKDHLFKELIQTFGLKETKESKALATLVLKNQYPIDKQSFTEAVKWLSSHEEWTKGIDILKMAFNRQVPISTKILDVLSSLQGEQSLIKLLETLRNQIKLVPKTNTLNQLHQQLNELLDLEKNELALNVMKNLKESVSNHPEAASLLHKAGVQDGSLRASVSSKELVSLKEWAERYQANAKALQTILSPSEQKALSLAVKEAESHLEWGDGNKMYTAMKAIFESLGTDLEFNLSRLKQGCEIRLDTLKSLLLKVTNEGHPAVIQEHSEAILARLSSLQVLSQESGPTQHIFMQIPLPFAFMKNDLTLQWEGRKMGDGKIDPDYCRILFYLDLQNLNETIVDMNVQNKVVHLKIWTDDPVKLDIATAPFVEGLKENLKKEGYYFSALHIEPFIDHHSKLKYSGLEENNSIRYTGMDFRI